MIDLAKDNLLIEEIWQKKILLKKIKKIQLEIKKKYRRGWFNIFERREVSFRNIDITKFKNPFNHLPERFYLTKEEKEIVALYHHRSETGKNRKSEDIHLGNTLVFWYMMLYAKQVCSEEDFLIRQNDFQKLLKSCKEKELKLPPSYLQFFQTHDFLARFRTGDLSFMTRHRLATFPDNEDYFIIPFFGDSQGFCWWYLLLNKEGEHCILYNNYHWREIGDRLPNEPAPEYILCADSFEEFIVRLAKDIKILEEGPWEEKFKARFPQYFNITPKELLAQFPEDRKLLKKR